MQKQFTMNPQRTNEIIDTKGNNSTRRKLLRKLDRQDSRNLVRETHCLMTGYGLQRRKDGNKLGMRKREAIADESEFAKKLREEK